VESNNTRDLAKLTILFLILLVITLLFAFKASAVCSTDPADYLFFDDFEGTMAKWNNNSCEGGITTAEAANGSQSAQLSGAGSDANCFYTNDFNLSMGNMTVEFMAKTQATVQNLYTAGLYRIDLVSDVNYIVNFWGTDGAAVDGNWNGYKDGNWITYGVAEPTTQWHYVIWEINPETGLFDITVNGTKVSDIDPTNVGGDFTGLLPNPLGLGSDSHGGSGGSFYIDDVRVWNRTLYGTSCPPAPPAPATGVTQRTFVTSQTGLTFLTSTSYQTIFSGAFNTSNTTDAYSYYTVPLLANISNNLTCRIVTDGTIISQEVERTNTAGAIGNMQLMESNTSVTAGVHTQELQCKVTGGGEVIIGFAKGIGNLMSNKDGVLIAHQYNATNATTTAGAAFTEIDAFNFTSSTTNTTLSRFLVVDWVSEYRNQHSGAEELNLQLRIQDPANVSDSTNCSFYPRDVSAGGIGSIGGVCLHRNSAVNTTYTVSLFGVGSNATYDFQSHIKELLVNTTAINTTSLNGTDVDNATLTKLLSINITNTGITPATLLAKAGISSRTASGTTAADFQINIVGASQQNGTPIPRVATTSDGVLVVQEGFSVPTGDFTVELWGLCDNANCELTGGDLTAYITESINITLNSFNVTVFDAFTGSSVSNFTATIEGGPGFQSTGGVATVFTTQSAENITISSTDYFSREVLDHNTSELLNTTIHQAEVHLDARELQTSNNLSDVTFFVGSFSGTEFNITAGNHTVIAQKAGYFNLTKNITVTALFNGTINLTGMYDGLANVSVLNGVDNSSISNYTIDTQNGDSITTTNGTIFLPLLQNTTTLINISADNLASLLNYSIEINQIRQDVNITMWAFNSVRINIFNESNFLPLLQTVTISTISNLTSFINTTAAGFIIVDFLMPNTYELRFTSANFNPRSIFLTVTNDSTQNITVYMTENATTELQVIEVLDTSNSPVEGAVVWLQKEQINRTNEFITVQEAQTDFNGKTSVFVQRDVTIFYRFAVIVNGVAKPIQPSGNLFTGKTSFIPGITETIQIIVNLETTPTDFISDSLDISTNVTFTAPDNRTVVYTFLDGRNSITGGRLLIEASYINESLDFLTISNQALLGSSGTINFTIPEINNTVFKITAFVTFANSEEIVWEGEKRFEIDVIIDKYTGLLYAVIILLVVAALTVTSGPLPSSLMTVATMIPLTYFKIIGIPTTIITSLLALCVIFFLRTRKLDE